VVTVPPLCTHFGEALHPRIGRLVDAKPYGGNRAHSSRLEEYGLGAALERERYARYMAYFGVRPEPGRKLPRSATSLPLLASPRRSA